MERAFAFTAQHDAGDGLLVDPAAESAAETINAWVAGGGDDRLSLRACLVLGWFEIAYRSGRTLDPVRIAEAEIDELHRLVEVTGVDWLKQARTVVLNPVFDWVRGESRIAADGELLVDRELVELKTGRRRKLMDDWRQLAGYVALNDLRNQPLPIERVAIYYVRFWAAVELPR